MTRTPLDVDEVAGGASRAPEAVSRALNTVMEP
jgi:hypothetical protein